MIDSRTIQNYSTDYEVDIDFQKNSLLTFKLDANGEMSMDVLQSPIREEMKEQSQVKSDLQRKE